MVGVPSGIESSQKRRQILEILCVERVGAAERHRQTVGRQRISLGDSSQRVWGKAPATHVVFGRDLEESNLSAWGVAGVEHIIEKFPTQAEPYACRMFRFHRFESKRVYGQEKLSRNHLRRKRLPRRPFSSFRL